MKNISFILIFIAILLFQSCSPKVTKLEAYKQMYEEKPATIMIMPPINKSTKVEAKMSFYNTLAVPLANNGYYVLPPSLAMGILQDQSAYDAEALMDKSMNILNKTFAVDAVLFTVIHEWRKLMGSSVEVKIEYILKSTKTDEVLFDRVGVLKVNSTSNSGNAFADLAIMIIKTVTTKEVTVAERCNDYSFEVIPQGKYSPLFGKDGNSPAGKKEFKVTLTQ